MLRLLILVLAVVVLLWLVRRAVLGRAAARSGAAPGTQLVACAHCGLLLPETEAHALDTRWYCSDQHARYGPRSG